MVGQNGIVRRKVMSHGHGSNKYLLIISMATGSSHIKYLWDKNK